MSMLLVRIASTEAVNRVPYFFSFGEKENDILLLSKPSDARKINQGNK
jgi:hypothetical protein